MKRRAIRATFISLVISGLSYIGQTTGGGEGFFPDPNQPVQGADLGSILIFGGFVWVLAFLPWKSLFKGIQRK